jgi:hypothetical protein
MPRGLAKYAPFIDELKSEPGEWKIFPLANPSNASVTAAQLKSSNHSQYPAFLPRTDFEVKREGDTVFIRFIG